MSDSDAGDKKNSEDAELDMKLYLISEQKRIDAEEAYDKNQRGDAGALVGTKVNLASIFGISDVYKLQRTLNPKSNYRHNYIVLDSVNRLPAYDQYHMSWQYVNDAVFQQGTVNTKGPVRDLVGMRVYPIRAVQNAEFSGIYDSNFTLLIEEFVAQSFVSHEKRNFHFMLRNTINPQPPGVQTTITYQEFTPVNDGYFWFRKPITTINTLTISLGNPLVLIPIPLPTAFAVNSEFTNANPTMVTTTSDNGFSDGDRVIIENFTTDDPVADAVVIAAVNDPAGHIITLVDGISFTIPVDLSTITPSTDASSVSRITDESKRFIVPLELIYIEPDSSSIDN